LHGPMTMSVTRSLAVSWRWEGRRYLYVGITNSYGGKRCGSRQLSRGIERT
jgi:hypothetical protein